MITWLENDFKLSGVDCPFGKYFSYQCLLFFSYFPHTFIRFIKCPPAGKSSAGIFAPLKSRAAVLGLTLHLIIGLGFFLYFLEMVHSWGKMIQE